MVFGRDRRNYEKVLIAGPTRVGKSTRLDSLEEHHPDQFERGEKYKYRRVGGPWTSDDKKKDSKVLRTEEEGKQLMADGKIAFDYEGVDTWHLVGLKDSQRTDKHIVYLSDTNTGARAFRQYFNGHIIPFLFYTSPVLIESRLKDAQRYASIPDEQIAKRLNKFEEEFAAFERNAEHYLFPIHIKWPPIDCNIVLPEGLKDKEVKEVKADVHRIVSLVNIHHKYHKSGINVEEFHDAYSNDISGLLVGNDLPTLRAKLENWKSTTDGNGGLRNDRAVVIDLTNELNRYKRPISDEVKGVVRKVKVVDYTKFNGRHTIALEGLVNPYSPRVGASPEDVVLDLIEAKIGQPTQRRLVRNEAFEHDSYFGLVTADNALLRDGAHYSLGDPLRTVPKHPSISIIFLYSQGGKVNIRGHSLDEILGLPQRFENLYSSMSNKELVLDTHP